MSFTDQKPRIATERDLSAPWSGGKPGEKFRCGFCGHKFKLGDQWRWVYTNDSKLRGASGNPFVCASCDAPNEELILRRVELYQEYMSDKFWTFRRDN